MDSLFNTLQTGAFRAGVQARTKKSSQWFERKVKELGDVSPRTVLKAKALAPTTKPQIGDMMMYFYDPKTKATLPYYDRFPLTIMVQPAKGGFHGLNLHYLSPRVRAQFLDELMELAPKNMTDSSRLTKMRYKLLTGVAKYKEFQPCYKHYLMGHVASRMSRVPMPEWEIAVFLPTEQFMKVKKESVWRYSRKQYAG